MSRSFVQTALTVVAMGIALADLAQPIFLDWRPKFVGALGGAALYATVAFCGWTGRRWGAWIAVLLPVLPATTLVLAAAGVDLPVDPDLPMMVIFGGQLTAAVLAARWLMEER